jgi:hypothetical protein
MSTRHPSKGIASNVYSDWINRSIGSEVPYSPTVRRIDEETRVEDGQTERVQLGHHPIRRRIIGILDHIDISLSERPSDTIR